MDYLEICKNAREIFGSNCLVCPTCNGKACANRIPGPGCKPPGLTAVRNYENIAYIIDETGIAIVME